MNLKAVFILSIFINPFILLSQEEEKTPLWIEKGETIISIKPGAKIAIKEPQKSIEKIIKYVDVDQEKYFILMMIKKYSRNRILKILNT